LQDRRAGGYPRIDRDGNFRDSTAKSSARSNYPRHEFSARGESPWRPRDSPLIPLIPAVRRETQREDKPRARCTHSRSGRRSRSTAAKLGRDQSRRRVTWHSRGSRELTTGRIHASQRTAPIPTSRGIPGETRGVESGSQGGESGHE